MRTLFILFSFIIATLTVKAQEFAIVNDPDGFLNMRKAPNTKSPVAAKINNGDLLIFYDDDQKSNWRNMARPTYFSDFSGKNNSPVDQYLDGYVYENRLVWVSKWPGIKNRYIRNNQLVIKNDSIIFTLSRKTFLVKNHKVGKDREHYQDKVDHRHAFGTDGDLPRKEIATFALLINNRKVTIPKNAYSDLFEPNLDNVHIYFDKKGTIYVEMLGSDGAGYYDVIWLFKNGKLVKRYLDNSNA